MPRKERHTKRVDAIVNKMRQGEILVRQCSQRESDEGSFIWWLEPSGKSVGPVTAKKILSLPTIRGGKDGLFGMSQTYRYEALK